MPGPLAAAAAAIPSLLGGGGGSSKVSNSVSSSVGAAVNPAITVNLGGGVTALTRGDVDPDAPSLAYALGEDEPLNGLPGLGWGQGVGGAPPSTPRGPDVTGGGGDLMSLLNDPIVLIALAGGAFLLLRG